MQFNTGHEAYAPRGKGHAPRATSEEAANTLFSSHFLIPLLIDFDRLFYVAGER